MDVGRSLLEHKLCLCTHVFLSFSASNFQSVALLHVQYLGGNDQRVVYDVFGATQVYSAIADVFKTYNCPILGNFSPPQPGCLLSIKKTR